MKIKSTRLPPILRPPWPVSRLLVLLAASLAIPTCILITWGGYRIAQQERKELVSHSLEIAERIAADVDQTLGNYITLLKTLATSPALATNDFATFYQQAKAALEPAGLFACLHTPAGHQIFSTRAPFGAPIPDLADFDQSLLATKEPDISNVMKSSVAEQPIISVSVPIMKDGSVTYILSLSVDLAFFKYLLERQHLPSQWTVGIADRKGIIIARSQENDEFAGKSIPRGDVAKYGIPSTQLVDVQGRKVILGRSLSKTAGWSIAAFIPTTVANSMVGEAIFAYLALVFLLEALGIAAALYIARLIVGPLSEVRKAAEALGTGESITLRHSVVEETQAALEALAHSADQRKVVEGDLQQAMERFVAADEGAGGLVYDWDVRTNRVWRSDGLTRMLGWKQEEVPPTPQGWLNLVHPDDQERLGKLKLVKETDAQGRYAIEARVRHRDGHYLWVWDRGRVFRDERGTIIRTVGATIDITIRKTLEQQQALLLSELTHRSKNLLGVIQVVATRTLAHSSSTSEARSALSQRLESLSRTYDTLTRNPTHNAPIAEIVHDELNAFESRVQIDGPEILLNPKAAQTIALVVHELATNAAKYGSLSVADGIVTVHWRKVTNGRGEYFHFSWRESGGPPVQVPKRLGFGSVLTQEVACHQFAGKVNREFLESGLSYKLVAPLSNLTTQAQHSQAATDISLLAME